MLTPSKITAFTALYLLAFALVPGITADFLLVPERARLVTLAACALFLMGFLLGAKLAGYGLYPNVGRPNMRGSAARGSEFGLLIVGVALLAMTAYIIQFGPKSPVLAAASGYDLIEVALIREEAIKLNQDALFVKIYSYTRDVFGPAAFVLALASLKHPSSRIAIRAFSLILLCTASFVAVWSGQKATLINYILAAIIYLSRDAASLMRTFVIGAPAFALSIFLLFLANYPDAFAGGHFEEVLEDIGEGMIHRLFISPFEVSIAYVDAIDYQKIINWLDTVPIFGAMLRPGVPSVENAIGTHYFYSGIDSISANALCFAYAYIVGGLPFCFLIGGVTSMVVILSMKFVRTGGNEFIANAFQIVLVYKLIDLLNGNPLSYLIGIIEIAVIAWILARVTTGVSMLRVPSAVGRAS